MEVPVRADVERVRKNGRGGVYQRTWQNIDKFDEAKGSIRGWLFRVAHNIAIDSKGNIYTAEVQGQRVQKFRNLGGL